MSRVARPLSGSRGVRRIEAANLIFPEEMPDLIAQEAIAFWHGRYRNKQSVP
jgi:hypothetical protein